MLSPSAPPRGATPFHSVRRVHTGGRLLRGSYQKGGCRSLPEPIPNGIAASSNRFLSADAGPSCYIRQSPVPLPSDFPYRLCQTRLNGSGWKAMRRTVPCLSVVLTQRNRKAPFLPSHIVPFPSGLSLPSVSRCIVCILLSHLSSPRSVSSL